MASQETDAVQCALCGTRIARVDAEITDRPPIDDWGYGTGIAAACMAAVADASIEEPKVYVCVLCSPMYGRTIRNLELVKLIVRCTWFIVNTLRR